MKHYFSLSLILKSSSSFLLSTDQLFYASSVLFSEECFYNDVRTMRKLLLKFTLYVFHHVFLQVLFLQSWKLAQRGLLKRSKKTTI